MLRMTTLIYAAHVLAAAGLQAVPRAATQGISVPVQSFERDHGKPRLARSRAQGLGAAALSSKHAVGESCWVQGCLSQATFAGEEFGALCQANEDPTTSECWKFCTEAAAGVESSCEGTVSAGGDCEIAGGQGCYHLETTFCVTGGGCIDTNYENVNEGDQYVTRYFDRTMANYTLTAPGSASNETACEGVCNVIEDPHISVFDGAQVSLLSVSDSKAAEEAGDMWVVKGTNVSVQARFLPDDNRDVSRMFVRAVAVGGPFLSNNTLVIGPLSDAIRWNDREILSEQESIFDVEGLVHAQRHLDSHLVGNVSVRHPGVDLVLPLGIKLTVNRQQQHVNIAVKMRKLEGGQEGLCGNFNGIASDDTLEMMRKREVRVEPSESLFSHFL